jgi:hypothetical protein
MAQRKNRAATRRGRAATRDKARKSAKSVRGKSAKCTHAKISPKESWGATMGSADWPRLQRPVDRLRDLITADRASTADPGPIGPGTKRHSLKPPSR